MRHPLTRGQTEGELTQQVTRGQRNDFAAGKTQQLEKRRRQLGINELVGTSAGVAEVEERVPVDEAARGPFAAAQVVGVGAVVVGVEVDHHTAGAETRATAATGNASAPAPAPPGTSGTRAQKQQGGNWRLLSGRRGRYGTSASVVARPVFALQADAY